MKLKTNCTIQHKSIFGIAPQKQAGWQKLWGAGKRLQRKWRENEKM